MGLFSAESMAIFFFFQGTCVGGKWPKNRSSNIQKCSFTKFWTEGLVAHQQNQPEAKGIRMPHWHCPIPEGGCVHQGGGPERRRASKAGLERGSVRAGPSSRLLTHPFSARHVLWPKSDKNAPRTRQNVKPVGEAPTMATFNV